MAGKSSLKDAARKKGMGGTRVLIALLVAAVGLPTFIGLFGGYERTSGGEAAVVRNGGWFDDNKIRQIIQPASGLTWTGFWSHVHKYPAQQRFYTITSSARGERPGVDVVNVPSSDGVNMGIEGTLYFRLNTDPAILSKFDDKFGTRKFRTGTEDEHLYPFDGDEGWSAFLDQIVRPVIDNDLRAQVNNFRCAELVSSCALVQNSQDKQVALRPQGNNANIGQVQNAINTSFAQNLKGMLGDEFLTDIHFNLARVTLPTQVQQAVDNAQAAFARVTEAQAKVAQAKAEADANRARQNGYNTCPTCAEIEKLRALPQGITVYAPGNPGGVAVPTK